MQRNVCRYWCCFKLVGAGLSTTLTNIIAQNFKNTRSFVHQNAAQRDFGEWDL